MLLIETVGLTSRRVSITDRMLRTPFDWRAVAARLNANFGQRDLRGGRLGADAVQS